jgi:hypothetical protein
MKSLVAWIAAVLLAACTSPPGAKPPASTAGAAEQAVATPLHDLHLVRADIPPLLQAAALAPYAMPSDSGCAALAADVQALDAVLGADLDVKAPPSDPGLIERGATDALRSAAEGVVPFRGWVRKLSGAQRYERNVAAAIAAGTVRRAFLKGLAQAGGCAPPAAPRR